MKLLLQIEIPDDADITAIEEEIGGALEDARDSDIIPDVSWTWLCGDCQTPLSPDGMCDTCSGEDK